MAIHRSNRPLQITKFTILFLLLWASSNGIAALNLNERIYEYTVISTDRMIAEYGNESSSNTFIHVAGGGDINGDGYQDIVGYNDVVTSSSSTSATVYYGNAHGVIDVRQNIQNKPAGANSIDIIGDINGDGFDDVAVGSAYYNTNGAVFVFLGSANGLIDTPHIILESDNPAARLGWTVSGAGDIDGDGYDDLIAGAPNYNDSHSAEGAFYIYMGSSTGFQANPDLVLDSNITDLQWGSDVSGAGDINGDGFDDVVVGAYSYRPSTGIKGMAKVYLGSAQGVDPIPHATFVGDIDPDPFSPYLGASVSGVGDLNGDGFDDIAMTEYKESNGSGWVRIYYGSQQGFTGAVPKLVSRGGSAGQNNDQIGALGDINADGYDDLIVGNNATGTAFIYLGARDGLEAFPIHSLDFGFQVGTGWALGTVAMGNASDFNGDGYSDVLLSNHQEDIDSDGAPEGAMFILLAQPNGLRSLDLSSQVIDTGMSDIYAITNIGDINGDGYEDAIASDHTFGNVQYGKVSVHLGSATGLVATPQITLTGDTRYPDNAGVIVRRADEPGVVYTDADRGDIDLSHFGFSVSRAGDVNNDGYDDVIIVAKGNFIEGLYEPFVTVTEPSAPGSAAFIFHGGTSGLSANPHSIILPGAGHAFINATGGGDINGDNFDDIVLFSYTIPAFYCGEPVGGIVTCPLDRLNSDVVYTYRGSATGIILDVPTPGYDNTAQTSLVLGYYPVMEIVGDVNQDGYDDFIISYDYEHSNGWTHLFLGNQSGVLFNNGVYDFPGIDNDLNSYNGREITSGDFNNDGFADVIITGPKVDGSSNTSWLAYGSASIGTDLTANAGGGGDNITGLGFDLNLPGGYLEAVDVNGDGIDDLAAVAGANCECALPTHNENTQRGLYFYMGSTTGLRVPHIELPTATTLNDGLGQSSNTNVYKGTPYASGDFNNDGFADYVFRYIADGSYPSINQPNSGIINTFFGQINDLDLDGVTDDLDAFPFDPTETVDTDGDGVGDNADASPIDPNRTTTIAPVITPVTTQVASLGGLLEISLSITDADGDTPTVSILSGPSFATVTGNTISIAPSLTDVGEFTVVVEANDGFKGISTSQFMVTIYDLTAPVVTVPGNIVVDAKDVNGTPSSNSAVAIFLSASSALDNLDGTIAGVTNDAPTVFPLGDTLITFSATDAAGNTGSATATITIADLTAPMLIVPTSIQIQLNTGNSILATDSTVMSFLMEAAAADNVDTVVGISNNAPASLGLGVSTVTFTAMDAVGNTATSSSTITLTSLDNDSDGLPNSVELANGLNIDDPSDANADLDSDGLTNLEEFIQGTNIAVDDVGPVITIPSNIVTDSTGPLTPVDLGIVTANDANDGDIVPTVDNAGPFAPGSHIVIWSSTDLLGNTSTAQQIVDVIPMVSFAPSQTIDEGTAATISVTLNGDAVSYPVTVPYTISGTAENPADHNASNGSIEITSGTQGSTTVDTATDVIWEGLENIVITMGTPVNAVPGSVSEHTVTIKEENAAPAVTILISQAGQLVTTVMADGGEVQLSAQISDPNPADAHTRDWSGTDNNLVPVEGYSDVTFTFDPSGLTGGVYPLVVVVTDDGETALSGDTQALILVSVSTPVLSTILDTDGDNVVDADEGVGDADMDRIPDYLDAVDQPNLLPASSGTEVLQTDAGLALRLGKTAFASGSADAQVSIEDIGSFGGAAGGVATNAGAGEYDFPAGIFDFDVTGLEVGSIARVVLPLTAPIPANAVYRKYFADTGWFDFIEDINNSISSALGQPGVCPAPGDVTYVPGLIEGNNCVQLSIQDGGPNDADGNADGVVVDPGGVATLVDQNINQDSSDTANDSANNTPSESGGGGGSIAITGLMFLLMWNLYFYMRNPIALGRHRR